MAVFIVKEPWPIVQAVIFCYDTGDMSEAADGTIAYELDLASGQLRWNSGLQTVLGYGPAEPATKLEWWTDHIHPDDAMILNQTMDKLFDPFAMEWAVQYRVRKADNTYTMVHDEANIERDQTGEAIRLRGVLTPLAPPPLGAPIN
jgi:PAS domain-containing protein